MATATEVELTKRMDALVQTFSVIGRQIKDMQDIVAKTASELTEVKTEQKAQGVRVMKLEEDRDQDRLRLHILEDRSRRANIRLRGFKQDFADGKNMIQKVRQWLKDNKIEIAEEQMERAHWVFGMRRSGIQRDIIIKFLLEKTATEVYKDLKKITNLNCKGIPIRVLKDLSRLTLQARNKMRPVADALFQRGVRFSWQYPAIIIVYKDGKMYQAKSLDDGKELLVKLGFDLDLNQQAEKEVGAAEAVGNAGVKRVIDSFATAFQPLEMDVGGEIKALEERLALLKEKEKTELQRAEQLASKGKEQPEWVSHKETETADDLTKEGRITRQKRK